MNHRKLIRKWERGELKPSDAAWARRGVGQALVVFFERLNQLRESERLTADSESTKLRSNPMVRVMLEPNGWLLYDAHFVAGQRELMMTLIDVLPLRTEVVRVGGFERVTPRLVSWHADPGVAYTYSGVKHEPHPWTPQLGELRASLKTCVGGFNSVLVNYYRDGDDSIGFHADDEPELGPEAPSNVLIASVSLGCKRRFVLKHRSTGEKKEFMLGGGDLLVMGGDVQQHWLHGVPKTTAPVLPRMNLTFRQVRP